MHQAAGYTVFWTFIRHSAGHLIQLSSTQINLEINKQGIKFSKEIYIIKVTVIRTKATAIEYKLHVCKDHIIGRTNFAYFVLNKN